MRCRYPSRRSRDRAGGRWSGAVAASRLSESPSPPRGCGGSTVLPDVLFQYLVGRSGHTHGSLLQPHDAAADAADLFEVMAYEDDRPPLAVESLDLRDAARLKFAVDNGEDFIEDVDVRRELH